jgi:uncharacterized protein YdaU (DUF1376 family)
MHHYPFHPGDYLLHTAHLEPLEDLAYRRLLDLYYTTEGKIPLETEWVAKRVRLDSDLVSRMLNEFFVETADGWKSARCDAEIAEYKARAERNRTNGKAGGRPKKTQPVPSGLPDETQPQPSGNLTRTRTRTNNQEPDSTSKGLSECIELSKPLEPSAGTLTSRPTLSIALLWAAEAGISPDIAKLWWESRDADGWTKSDGGGGQNRITPGGERSDLSRFNTRELQRIAEQAARAAAKPGKSQRLPDGTKPGEIPSVHSKLKVIDWRSQADPENDPKHQP